MNTYLFKCLAEDKNTIIKKLKKDNCKLVYCSPVLPIIGIEGSEDVINDIQENYYLDYLVKNPRDGVLQDLDGVLFKNNNKSTISIIPALDYSLLRNLSYTGWGTTVAVLDSGVSEEWITEHHDFTGYGSTPAINHGTMVANIIKKFAPGSIFMSFKVCHDPTVKLIDLLKAIDVAVEKADILNLSLGFNHKCSNELPCSICEVINYYTHHKGKLFIVAAGNDGTEGSIACPGNAQESITVGAINEGLSNVADYSSKGEVGVKKPNIITSGRIRYNNDYDDGTSYAAPVITGVSAAIYTIIEKDILNLKSYLYSTATDIGAPEHHQGFGHLNLENFVEVVKGDESNIKSKRQKQN